MIYIFSTILATFACLLLLFSPETGILAIYFSRPFIDVCWEQAVIFGFKLTELVSSLVPVITIFIVFYNRGTERSVTKMPFFWLWMFYIFYIFLCSINIATNTSFVEGLSVFFRYLNGFVGFYLAQSYFRHENKVKKFYFLMAIAGLFPILQGVYEAFSGYHWTITSAEGDVRNIGMYHDAITIRYYGLQTLLATAACLAIKYPNNLIVKLGLMGLLFGSLLTVYKALSKSGMMTLALWVAIWSYGRRSWYIPILVFILTLFIVPIYFNEIIETIFKQFHKEIGAVSGEVATNRTFAGRWHVWEQMWKEWEHFSFLQKIFGSGRTAFGAHNDYLQMLFTGGYFGLLLYIILLSSIGWRLVFIYFKSKNLYGTLALMAYVMWIVDTIGLVPSLYSGYQWFVWGVVGLCLRFENDNASIERKNKTFAINKP